MAEEHTYPALVQAMLERRVPPLPRAELHAFVEGYAAQRQRFLEPLAGHASPLYLFDREALVARASELREAFWAALPAVGCFFALKSNNYPDVARTLAGLGFGLDVSSGLELAVALDAGAAEIVFSGPGKTDPELQLAVKHNPRVTVLLDSFAELERLEAVAAAQGRRVEVGVRCNPKPEGLWRKFGIPLSDLTRFWEQVGRTDRLRLRGLQFHCSWNLDPVAQVAFLGALGETLRQAPRALCESLRFVDIGGGFWPPAGEWLQRVATPEGALRSALGLPTVEPCTHYRLPAAPIGEFAEAIGHAVREHLDPVGRFRVCVEPGRWVCNDAMHLLMSVVDRKASDLVITDAGTNAVGWERFESDYAPVINLTRPALQEHACLVVGSLCTPHDVWGYSYFGADIQVGDTLLIPCQGAYTYSLRQHFIKPLPQVVALSPPHPGT